MTHSRLLVPIHLDALVLTESQLSVGPSAHFAKLPHVWQGRDVHPDAPNLGTSVRAPPFQDRSFLLERGVHLHWALPDGLTRARHVQASGSQTVAFPTVPNRWLVVRRRQHGGRWLAEKQWVVESDYLWPENHDSVEPLSVPSAWSSHGAAKPAARPYQFLGRFTPYEKYPAPTAGGSHLARPLTAMGYGEPAFATIYQNCKGVFTFHDADTRTVETRYDVFGWYSDAQDDPLADFPPSGLDEAARAAAVEARFGWTVSGNRRIPAGTQTVCYVSMTIPPSPAIHAQRSAAGGRRDVEVAVGNTGTEALSAYLASSTGVDAKRDEVENQLESILLDQRLAGKQLDKAARLADARHEKGFVASFGGYAWTVKPQDSPDHGPQQAGDEGDASDVAFDPDLSQRLTELNAQQRQYDRGVHDVEAARARLFTDWCKYMHVLHPAHPTWQEHSSFDGDELRVFVEEQAKAVEVLLETQNVETTAKLKEALGRAEARLSLINEERKARKAKPLALYRLPGPRFYRPTELALLIHGEAVRVTERHGQDGRHDADDLLHCDLSTAALWSAERKPDADAVCKAVDALRPKAINGKPPPEKIGFCKWEAPWHPILLEWEVELLPMPRNGDHGDHARDHVTSRWALARDAVELSADGYALPGKDKSGPLYRGTSILTPHAMLRHADALRTYVAEQCGCSVERVVTHRADVEDEYRRKLQARSVAVDDLVCIALCALDNIEKKDFLSQSLTGINEAFLGLVQNYQLPVDDPLGFKCERALAERVRDLVQSFNRSAPDESSGFEPVRAGLLRIKRLRLVDTFGQIEDLRFADAPQAVSHTLRAGGGGPVLPPRFVQPARINLRWLSTTDGTAESNAAPASTPICGWLIIDHLDGGLLVYDAQGRALGVVSCDSEDGPWRAGWQAAPGNDASTQVRHIDDPHLRRVIEWLVRKSSGAQRWKQDVMDRIDAALEQIAPEAAAQCEDLAVLVGRPLAIVRAHLSVSLAGPPAIHHGDHALFVDMVTKSRRTEGFEDVLVPVRLGAHARANDGLVAYWRHRGDQLEAEAQWPQLDTVDPIEVAPSERATPQVLTMLVDPLAEVHATSGMLPTKAITIPASMYAAQLKRIELTFRSLGPILTRTGRLDLPLPIEPGYAWSWLEREDRGWSTVAGDVGATEDDGAFSGPILAREGWLRLARAAVPENGPPPPPVDAALKVT